MAYNKTTWVDRVVQYPHRYKDQSNNQLTLTQDPGTVTSAGTLITAGNLNKIETELESIDGAPVRSAVQSAYGAVLSMPASTKNGLIRGTLSGMTLNNAVVNGDFSGGTTGWVGSSNTIAVVNFELESTVTALSATNRVQYNSSILQKNTTDKWFLYGKIKPKYANTTYLQIGAVSGNLVTPTANVWNVIYSIITPSDTTSQLRMYHQTNTGYIIGDKYYTDDFIAINMTALGLDALTADQMKGLCDNGYFEGLKGSDVECVSVGKNLMNIFDYNKSISASSIISASGNLLKIKAIASDTLADAFPNIKYKPLTRYTFSGFVSEDIDATNTRMTIVYTDGTTSALHLTTTLVEQQFSTTTDVGKTVDILRVSYSSSGGTVTYRDLALVEGTIALSPYEPFKQSTLSLDKVLNRVPNGVADTHVLDTTVGTQNVQEYALVAGDVTLLDTSSGVNYDYALVSKKANFIGYGNVSYFNASYVQNFKGINSNNIPDVVGNTYLFSEVAVANSYVLTFPKGTYANLASAQTALAGTKILYQLATPVTTVYNKDLLAFESGTLYDNGLLPTYKQVTTPLNVAGGLEDLIINSANSEARHDTPILASGGYLADAFANIMLRFRTAIDKAVNYITIGNNIAGSAPYFEASGADTNIDLVADGKGTGRLVDKSLIKYLKVGEVNTSAVLSSEFTSTSTTYAQIPALTVAVTSGKVYNLTFTASHKHTAGNSSPISYSLYMPTGSGTIVGNGAYLNSGGGTTTVALIQAIGAIGLAGSGLSGLLTGTAYDYGTTINAVFTCLTSGTISVGVDCTTAGTMAVKAGSGITVTPII